MDARKLLVDQADLVDLDALLLLQRLLDLEHRVRAFEVERLLAASLEGRARARTWAPENSNCQGETTDCGRARASRTGVLIKICIVSRVGRAASG